MIMILRLVFTCFIVEYPRLFSPTVHSEIMNDGRVLGLNVSEKIMRCCCFLPCLDATCSLESSFFWIIMLNVVGFSGDDVWEG